MKTISLKKVVSIAVASLVFSGLTSIAPANASTWAAADALDCEVASVTTATGYCVAAAGNRVSLSNNLFTEASTTTYSTSGDVAVLTGSTAYYISFDGATLVSVTDGGTTDDSDAWDLTWGGTSDADGDIDLVLAHDGADGNETIAAGTSEIVLQRDTAGTAKVELFYFSSGVRTTVETHTITWVGAADASGYGISATNSQILFESDACEASGGSAAGDAASVLAGGDQITSAAAASGAVYVCVYTRDGNGNPIDPSSGQVITTKGSFVTDSTKSTTISTTSGALTSLTRANIVGTAAEVGPATVTAILTDSLGNTVTISNTVTFYGTLKTLTLANYGYASDYGVASTNNLVLVGKDAGGNSINLNAAANGTGTYTVDSSATAGVAAVRTSDAVGATVSSNFAAADPATYGGYKVSANCTASVKAEKLTITAWGTDSDGAYVSSNAVTYYCSDSAATVKVTPSATAFDSTGTVTAQVEVLDANGFPVADGDAVSLVANNGAGVSTPSTTTLNGKYKYAATVSTGSAGGTVTLTATSGGKVGSANVSSSGSSIIAQIDALNAKIVALNALIAKIMKKLGVK